MNTILRGRSLRALLLAAGLAASVLVVDGLADLTQTRPEQVQPGTRSELVLRVSARGGPQHADVAARQLWDSCRNQLRGGREVIGDGLVRTSDGRYRLVVSPALGAHTGRRLTGCLQDAKVDFVLARVESQRLLRAAQWR